MKKILVVDDDTDILEILKHFLLMQGFDARVSTTCDEGLDIFYNFLPDVVLLDVNVGSEDGRLMCRTVKTHAEHKDIPVLLMSANPEGLIDYAGHGAHGVIEKPFNIADLLALLQAAIRFANSHR